MPNTITILGSGTCQLQLQRAASSVVTEFAAGERFLFDCGRGVTGRLAELGLRQDDIEHIVISHFHPDHVSDLVPFLQAGSWSRLDPRTRDLHLYGPPGLGKLFDTICSAFAPNALLRGNFQTHLHEIGPGTFHLYGRTLEFVRLPHAENHGVRFKHGGRTYAFTGDSLFDDTEVDFLSGVDVGIIDAGHLSDEEIVELAVRSQAARLICSHLYRELNIGALNQRAAERAYRGTLVLAHDLMRVGMS